MRKVTLTKEILQVLRPALIGAKGTIKREIVNGESQLFQTEGNNLYLVIRPEGSEMVLVAMAGSRFMQSRQEIINFARTHQFESIRVHTKFNKQFERLKFMTGFKVVEVRHSLFGRDEWIYRMELI